MHKFLARRRMISALTRQAKKRGSLLRRLGEHPVVAFLCVTMIHPVKRSPVDRTRSSTNHWKLNLATRGIAGRMRVRQGLAGRGERNKTKPPRGETRGNATETKEILAFAQIAPVLLKNPRPIWTLHRPSLVATLVTGRTSHPRPDLKVLDDPRKNKKRNREKVRINWGERECIAEF